MKIAILLSGHLRTWEYCKQNFIDNFIDDRHDITVIIDTYTTTEVNDIWYTPSIPFESYSIEQKYLKSENEIKEYFFGISNIIFNIVPETRCDNSRCEEPRKLFNTFKILESLQENFDIVIRSRFDLKINKKIDYSSVYSALSENNKLLVLSHNNSYNFRRDLNPCFAMSTFENMKLFYRRDIDLFTPEQMVGRCLGHDTLEALSIYFGIIREWEFYNTAIVRDKFGFYMRHNPQFFTSPTKIETEACIELW